MKFYICAHCGNIITKVKDAKVPVMCCGQKMDELVPNSTEAAHEKHFPVIAVEGGKVSVTVSTVEHPMVDAHYIEWVALETEKGMQIKYLKPGEAPKAVFALEDDKLVAAYAYCNLHGLWKTEA